MAVSPFFPIYPDSPIGPFHCSLTIEPPFLSEISKSVGMTSSTALLIPNMDFLEKFIAGDIGIGDDILKSALLKNFNSPIIQGDEDSFKKFAKITEIPIDDPSKYKKDGKFKIPKQEIKVPSTQDLLGIKGLEKTLLKSIFETQKPYIEIAKLTIENLGKLEDILARIMPLASPQPLAAISHKPIANRGNQVRPKALGVQSGQEFKLGLGKIKKAIDKGKSVKVNPDGSVKITKTETPTANLAGLTSSGTNQSTNPFPSGVTYSIISTVYSTGDFSPFVEYQYSYIDLPAEKKLGGDLDNVALNDDGDPFKNYKPKCIIFGIFNSLGSPLDPLSPLESYDNFGNKVSTTFRRATWVVESPKWKFNYNLQNQFGLRIWPTYGTPNFQWERYGGVEKTISKTQPSAGSGQAWEVSRYKTNQKNRLNREDAIPGDPIIDSFDTTETVQYEDFFKDLIDFRLAVTPDITNQDKIDTKSAVYPQLNVPAHLENVFLYGQAKSSVYKKLPIPGLKDEDNPFPSSIQRSLKPYKIYSAEAAADPVLQKAFGYKMTDRINGNMWIDPEADYAMKVIRVDPTTQIEYTKPGSSTPIKAEIKAFIKNALTIQISDGRAFNIDVKKSTTPGTFFQFDSKTGATSYYLENWNYNDNDGILATGLSASAIGGYGLANNPPVLSNSNSYKVTIWGEKNTPYYDGVGGYIAWKIGTNIYVELEKLADSTWTYNKFRFNFDDKNEFAFTKLRDILEIGPVQIDTLWKNLKVNPAATYLYDFKPSIARDESTSGSLSNSKLNPTDGTDAFIELNESLGDLVYLFKYAKEFTIKAGVADSNDKFPEHTLRIKNRLPVYASKKTKIFIENSRASIDKSFYFTNIRYEIPLKILFSKKVTIPITGIVRLEEDDSIVEVLNGKIAKWYYMTTNDLRFADGKVGGYGNGELVNKPNLGSSVLTNESIINNTGGAYTINPLPNNGQRRSLRINLGDTTRGLWSQGNGSKQPIQTAQDQSFSNFQIRVATPDNPNGAIIDPSQVFNEFLKTDKPFLNIPGTKYGHGTSTNPQEIGVIKRFMLTEFDTESYYILEGVLPEVADALLSSAPNSNTNNPASVNSGDYYKLPDAIGAIKPFISILVDVFSKLIPKIKSFLELLKDPRGFIVDIITEKLGESFSLFSDKSLGKFKDAKNLKKEAGQKNSDFKNKVDNFFKASDLKPIVFTLPNADYKNVIDGLGLIPFSMFGKQLDFGIEMKFDEMKENRPPFKLITPANLLLSKQKNLQATINPFAKTTAAAGSLDLNALANANGTFNPNDPKYKIPNDVKSKLQNYEIINVKYSTGEFIEGVNYNFIYIDLDVQNLVKEADALLAQDTPDKLDEAKQKLDLAAGLDPKNELVKRKLKDLKKRKNFLESLTQPLLKFILGIVTIPIKIVASIVDYIMKFFKSLSNPLTLPVELAKFLSFTWFAELFTPIGLLEVAGIKFKFEKLATWIALVNVPNPAKTGGIPQVPPGLEIPEDLIYNHPFPKGDYLIPDDFEIADLNEFLNIGFNMKLPTYTAKQLREYPKNPLYLFAPVLCFIEKLINGIIDFFWSLLGLEAIIPPPHIKICKKTDGGTLSPEDISKILSGEEPKGGTSSGSGSGSAGSQNTGNTPATEEYIYEVQLPDGTIVKNLDAEKLQQYIDQNKDFTYDFNF